MRKVLIAVGVVIAVLIVVAVAVPFLVPTDTWKGEIERRASAATGRTLTISGPVRLSLLPAVAVVANDVTFANAPGGQAPNMATLGKLEVRVRALPLLSGNLVIDRFVLDKPVIHLEVDRQGRPNWEFAAKEPATAPAPQQPRTQQQPPQQQGGSALSGIQLGDVRISNGLITYADARSGARYEASDIDASLALQNLDSPFKADGSLVWNKEKIALKAEVAKPSALTSGQATKVGLTIDSKPVRFTFAGEAAGTAPAKLDGTITLDVPSVRGLAAWAGTKLDMPGDGLGPLSVKGTLAAQGSRVAFTKATYKLDAIEASGDVAIDASGRVPYAKATLTTNMLDLNPYLPPPAKPGAADASKPQAGGAAPASQSQGWSTEPIDASGLKAANADLSLTVAGLKVRDINTGKSVLNVALKDGRLNADLPELALYGGNGKGHLTVNGAERAPAVSMAMTFSGIQAEPLLKDAMGFERLRGTGDADVTLESRGGSQKALVSALNGKGSIKFHDGAVKGINLGAMMRNVGTAFLDAQAGKEQETDFAELSGTYTIANGILKNDDLAMQSPLLRVSGKGTVDLPQRTVNYRVEPKVVASAQGQGGRQDAGGLAVPVIVSGPWSNVSYKPDVAGLLQNNPEGALKSLRGLIPGQSSGGSGSGQTPAQGGSQQPQPQKQNPVDRLKGLLGR